MNETDPLDKEMLRLKHARAAGNREAVWERVEKELDQKPKRRPVFWMWYSAAATVLLLLGLGWVFLSEDTNAPALADQPTVEAAENPAPEATDSALKNASEETQTTTPETSASQAEGSQVTAPANAPKRNTTSRALATLPATEVPSGKTQQPAQYKGAAATRGTITKSALPADAETGLSNTSDKEEAPKNTPSQSSEPATAKEFVLMEPPPDPPDELVPAIPSGLHSIPVLEPGDRKRDRGWFTGGHVSPEWTEPSLRQDLLSLQGIQQEQPQTEFALTAGMQVGVRVHRRLEVLSGLNYSAWRGESEALAMAERPLTEREVEMIQNDTSGMALVNIASQRTVSDSVNSSFAVQFVEVPLTLRYKFWERKASYFVSTGVSAQLFTLYRNEITDFNFQEDVSSSNSDVQSRNAQFNMLLSVGGEYPLFSQLTFRVEPNMRFGLTQGTASVFEEPMRYLGLRTGLTYYFK